jgi:hypothetical protein
MIVSPAFALAVAQVATTMATARRRVVAADDEVIAGEEPVVELAEPKERNGDNPNNRRRDKPAAVRYLRIAGNGYPQSNAARKGAPASVSTIAT